MSARGVLTLVGTAVGGVIGWTGPLPAADPGTVRDLLAELGVRVGPRPGDLAAAVRGFQARVGLAPDGVAGPRTVHHLVRYANGGTR